MHTRSQLFQTLNRRERENKQSKPASWSIPFQSESRSPSPVKYQCIPPSSSILGTKWHLWHHYHHHHRSSSRIFPQHSQAVGKKGSRAFGKAWVATTMRIDLYHMTIASVTRHSWVDAARLVRISTTQQAAKKTSRRCKTAGNASTPSMRYIAKCYNTSYFFSNVLRSKGHFKCAITFQY